MADYGLMGGIGNFLKEGVDTYRGVKKDRADEQARQNALLLQASQAGYQFDPNTNSLSPTEGLIAKNQFAQKQAEEGLAEYDPTSDVSKNRVNAANVFFKQVNPNFQIPENSSFKDLKALEPIATAAAKIEEARTNKSNAMNFRDIQLKEKNDFRAHQSNVNKVKQDKILTDAAVKSTNLDNIITNVEKTGKITTNDMADIQSIAIDSMGMKGQSSAAERAERYAKTLGMKASEVLQFLTGTPQDIGKNNPLYQRYKDIMAMEIQNYRDRATKRIDFITAGNKSVYKRQPELLGDIDDLKSQFFSQLAPQSALFGEGQGLMGSKDNKEQPNGLLPVADEQIPEVGEIRIGKGGVKYQYNGGPINKKTSWDPQ